MRSQNEQWEDQAGLFWCLVFDALSRAPPKSPRSAGQFAARKSLLRWFPVIAVATAFLAIANGALAQQRYRTPDEAVAAKPILDLAAASPEPGIEGMPEKWRAAAADQLLAFSCCWPELPATVPLPQPGTGRTQEQPPAWPLFLLPLALCAMWSIRKLKREP